MKAFPPGFRFHPTDEELILYYLKRKICRRSLKLDIIAETDVYKWDPEELPGQSKLKTGDRQWFFFSPRDRKYPNGARSNRATMHGYWKATGKDRTITCSSRLVGIKKTLVFYKGRAPSGQRTDWVMHEYTLDEEELKRCRSAQDYYALYKVFKKSGPGPKNGEQYGAPFNEEEWADDENLDVSCFLEHEKSVQELNRVAPVDNRVNGQEEPPLNGFEQFPDKDSHELVLVPLPSDPVAQEKETQSNLLDYCSRADDLSVQNIMVPPSYDQCHVQPSFDLAYPVTSQLQQHEVSEVTAVPRIPLVQPNFNLTRSVSSHLQQFESSKVTSVPKEDFLEDYLEMDDLIGPEPTVQNVVPVENPQFDAFDGLCWFDLFHDAAMFLNDMGPGEYRQISTPCMDVIGNGMENSVSHSYVNNIESEVNYQIEPQTDDANQMSSELWVHDQRYSVSTPAEATYGAINSHSPGVVFDDNYGKQTSEANENLTSKEDDGTTSWLSSALWSFVDSIPTTPASASEGSALVNRAFERMSSFSRGRVNAQSSTDAASGNPTLILRRSSRSSSGIICFSVLGVLFALLWVFIRTSIEVLGRDIS